MTSRSLTAVPTFLRRLLPTRRGWIGVDFGTRAIKLAQVAWSGDQCRISARWVLTAPEAAPATADSQPAPISVDSAALKAASKVFQGHAVAASLPMSVLMLRTIDAPPGSLDETTSMIEQDLLADLPGAEEGVSFDFWDVPSKDARAAESQRYSVLAAPRSTVMTFADALFSAGYDSQVFDGAPCALARAIQLAEGTDDGEPVAAIDLGHASPVFVVAMHGKPLFSRQLRGCEMRTFTAPICENLEVPLSQAETLLGRFGVMTREAAEASAAEIATHHLVAEPLDRLVAELQRTLGYLTQQARDMIPKRLWLFGGGATWPGMAERLAERLNTPARPWTLAGSPADRNDALFGMAVALSALALENHACI